MPADVAAAAHPGCHQMTPAIDRMATSNWLMSMAVPSSSRTMKQNSSAIIVEECPRCGTKKITFEVKFVNYLDNGNRSQDIELMCVCRSCHRGTIFNASTDLSNIRTQIAIAMENETSIDNLLSIKGFVISRRRTVPDPPKYTPEHIVSSYKEGANCLSISCWNAACAMFRKCLDLSTREYITDVKINGKPLGVRLDHLFSTGKMDPELKDLVGCIKDDGNFGVHEGELTERQALDLVRFLDIFLDQTYTIPEKVRAAKQVIEERKASS